MIPRPCPEMDRDSSPLPLICCSTLPTSPPLAFPCDANFCFPAVINLAKLIIQAFNPWSVLQVVKCPEPRAVGDWLRQHSLLHPQLQVELRLTEADYYSTATSSIYHSALNIQHPAFVALIRHWSRLLAGETCWCCVLCRALLWASDYGRLCRGGRQWCSILDSYCG